VECVYADNYSSYKQAIKRLGATYERSQPGISKSNAIIERCNQDVLQGARVVLCQAGLPACFWPWAAP